MLISQTPDTSASGVRFCYTVGYMRTTSWWAFRRRLYYGAGFATLIFIFSVLVYFQFFYSSPNCFDGIQDDTEQGVDCGGDCVRICTEAVIEPNVKWARSFEVTDGLYNAVGYVENLNRTASAQDVRYTFTLYGEDGVIAERTGTTILPPNGVYPIFASRIDTYGAEPAQTFLELDPIDVWQPSLLGSEQFTLVERELSGVDEKPRLTAVLKNNDLEEAQDVEVVATIFDINRNALTSSRTFIENFAPRSETEIGFTWLEPIAKTIRSCEIPTDIMMAIDLSGSMNDDQDTPPEPITSVLSAASSFVERAKEKDQVGVVSFATEAQLVHPLGRDIENARQVIESLSIAPKEEVGSTNTGEAIVVAGRELLGERHDKNARKVMVLLTDGLATAPDPDPDAHALSWAEVAREEDVELYVIGLGEKVNMDLLRQIATSPQYAYQAVTRSDVDSIYRSISSSICEDGVAVIDIIAKTDEGFVPLR